MFGVERFAPRLPGGLLALVLGIAVSGLLHLSHHGVEVVGHVPGGLPTPGVPSVPSADLPALLAAAGGLMLVIFSESLGAANTFATKYGYEIDANQELIALGVANGGSGLLGGLAGGGSLSQYAVNEGAGARSEASPLVAATLIVVTVLLLTPLFRNLPEAVLAALIIHAVSHLWKVAAMRRLYSERRAEFWLGLATLVGVITLDVLPGLVIGVLSMLLLFVFTSSRPHVAVLGRVPGVQGAFGAIERHPDYEDIQGVLVLRLESPLFYANAAPTRDRIKRLVGTAAQTPRAVILEVGANDELDVTGAETLRELTLTLRSAGIDLALADVRHRVVDMARRTGLLDELGPGHVFRTVDEAIDATAAAGVS
jgi:MFS superfamily sulfate permease-like transporter